MTWLDHLRARLIDDWHKCWRLWSVQLSAAALALAPLAVVGDAAPVIISVLPEDLAALIDPAVLRLAPFILVVASMLLRLVKQKEPGE
jgi:hypothetical protein